MTSLAITNLSIVIVSSIIIAMCSVEVVLLTEAMVRNSEAFGGDGHQYAGRTEEADACGCTCPGADIACQRLVPGLFVTEAGQPADSTTWLLSTCRPS